MIGYWPIFHFSMDWDNSIAAKDPYNRFRFGIPPGQDKADFAFIQHMFSSLNEKRSGCYNLFSRYFVQR